VTRSQLIGHLLQRRREVADRGVAHGGGEASPDVAGLDRHSRSTSRKQAARSSIVSAVSLVPVAGGPGWRLVAALGIINSARSA